MSRVTSSYGMTLNIWRCLSSPPFLYQFFSKLNILSFYKYFSLLVSSALDKSSSSAQFTDGMWLLSIPLGYLHRLQSCIIISINYGHADVVDGQAILWTSYRIGLPLKYLSISWMMLTNCIYLCSCQPLSYSHARPLYVYYILSQDKSTPITSQGPWNLHVLIQHE